MLNLQQSVLVPSPFPALGWGDAAGGGCRGQARCARPPQTPSVPPASCSSPGTPGPALPAHLQLRAVALQLPLAPRRRDGHGPAHADRHSKDVPRATLDAMSMSRRSLHLASRCAFLPSLGSFLSCKPRARPFPATLELHFQPFPLPRLAEGHACPRPRRRQGGPLPRRHRAAAPAASGAGGSIGRTHEKPIPRGTSSEIRGFVIGRVLCGVPHPCAGGGRRRWHAPCVAGSPGKHGHQPAASLLSRGYVAAERGFLLQSISPDRRALLVRGPHAVHSLKSAANLGSGTGSSFNKPR